MSGRFGKYGDAKRKAIIRKRKPMMTHTTKTSRKQHRLERSVPAVKTFSNR